MQKSLVGNVCPKSMLTQLTSFFFVAKKTINGEQLPLKYLAKKMESALGAPSAKKIPDNNKPDSFRSFIKLQTTFCFD